MRRAQGSIVDQAILLADERASRYLLYVVALRARELNDVWLKRIFISTVLILAAKTLYDFAN